MNVCLFICLRFICPLVLSLAVWLLLMLTFCSPSNTDACTHTYTLAEFDFFRVIVHSCLSYNFVHDRKREEKMRSNIAKIWIGVNCAHFSPSLSVIHKAMKDIRTLLHRRFKSIASHWQNRNEGRRGEKEFVTCVHEARKLRTQYVYICVLLLKPLKDVNMKNRILITNTKRC